MGNMDKMGKNWGKWDKKKEQIEQNWGEWEKMEKMGKIKQN